MPDAGIPFLNLTIEQSDAILGAYRDGLGDVGARIVGNAYGVSNDEFAAYAARNREAIWRAKAGRAVMGGVA